MASHRDFATKPSLRFWLSQLCVLLIGFSTAVSVQELEGSKQAGSSLASLPGPAQAAISAALGRDDSDYHAVARSKGFRAKNPKHGLTAEFSADGVEVKIGTVQWTMALRRYGYGDTLKPLSRSSAPNAAANRVEYTHGTLTEWYLNGPMGLEQGFTLDTAPPRSAPGPLTFELALSGDLRPSIEPSGKALMLQHPDAQGALRYSGLVAYDSRNRALPTWLALESERLFVRVDDSEARYPVVVDPWVQQAKLTASDGASLDQFGFSVAISGDTVIVGAYGGPGTASSDQGAAYLFVKPLGGWINMTETFKLTASDGVAGDQFGLSVAISGNTVVVGAPGDDTFQGAAYVFVEPGSGWTTMTENAKLLASDRAANDSFGTAVAISDDTSTVVVGAAHKPYPQQFGAAYVFVKLASGWAGTFETAKLTASDEGEVASLGSSVAISDDTVVVGAEGADISSNSQQGAAYVFVRPGTLWIDMTETAKLTASDGDAGDHFGVSVAASGDTAVVGAFAGPGTASSDQGAAYVFVRPTSGWTSTDMFDAKLTASDGAFGSNFGTSVAISGPTVVVGAYQGLVAGTPTGAAYLFVKPVGAWTDMTDIAKLFASDGVLFGDFGTSVAISGDTVVVGADRQDDRHGAAYVFAPRGGGPAGPRRMAGGGSVFQGSRVTHGFELYCDISLPNDLEINWSGNRFRLTQLNSATCSDATDISEGHPVAGFDTFAGSGVGRLNGVDGATIDFKLTDAGEPGQGVDLAEFSINGGADLVVAGTLNGGNHQAHPE